MGDIFRKPVQINNSCECTFNENDLVNSEIILRIPLLLCFHISPEGTLSFFIPFDGIIHQQIAGIPIGRTVCTPHIADLFLYCYG